MPPAVGGQSTADRIVRQRICLWRPGEMISPIVGKMSFAEELGSVRISPRIPSNGVRGIFLFPA